MVHIAPSFWFSSMVLNLMLISFNTFFISDSRVFSSGIGGASFFLVSIFPNSPSLHPFYQSFPTDSFTCVLQLFLKSSSADYNIWDFWRSIWLFFPWLWATFSCFFVYIVIFHHILYIVGNAVLMIGDLSWWSVEFCTNRLLNC